MKFLFELFERNDARSRILQTLLFFVFYFILLCIVSKCGRLDGEIKNPYTGSNSKPITWQEFIYTIPAILAISASLSLFYYIFINLGNKKQKENDEDK